MPSAILTTSAPVNSHILETALINDIFIAKKALDEDDKIGVMLPCNIIIQQKDKGVEVAAIDPVASMVAVDNLIIKKIAIEIRAKLKAVIKSI